MLIIVVKAGALVNKIKAFSDRKWARSTVKLVDVFDFFGAFISIELQNFFVIRVLPEVASALWLLDLIKFWYVGATLVPLFQILLRIVTGWLLFFDFCRLSLLGSFRVLLSFFRASCLCVKVKFMYYRRVLLSVVLGDVSDFESVMNIRAVSLKLDTFCFYTRQARSNFNDLLILKEQFLDYVTFFEKFSGLLLFYCDVRLELPRLFLFLQSAKQLNFIFSFGIKNYSINLVWHLGNTFNKLIAFCQGKSKILNNIFFSKKLLFLFGHSLLERNDVIGVEHMLFFLKKKLIRVTKDSFYFVSAISMTLRVPYFLGVNSSKKWLLKTKVVLPFVREKGLLYVFLKKRFNFFFSFFFSANKLLVFNEDLFDFALFKGDFVFFFSPVVPRLVIQFDLFLPVIASLLSGGLYLNFCYNWFLNETLNVFLKNTGMLLSQFAFFLFMSYSVKPEVTLFTIMQGWLGGLHKNNKVRYMLLEVKTLFGFITGQVWLWQVVSKCFELFFFVKKKFTFVSNLGGFLKAYSFLNFSYLISKSKYVNLMVKERIVFFFSKLLIRVVLTLLLCWYPYFVQIFLEFFNYIYILHRTKNVLFF